ncbi:2-hydroxyacid dehydrogenase [bacterium]|nr:2-hydroxyacid dehydrogenase [bacterium]
MKIAVFSTQTFDRTYFSELNKDLEHEIEFFEAALNEHTTNLTQGFDAICVFVNDTVDSEVIQRLSENGVKLVALRCAGFNNVDIEAASKHNIKVVRVPRYSPQSVAEHAVALILTLNRKTHKAYNRIREGNFSLERLKGFELAGKTVGVIGTGFIGAFFSRIMLGFGCKVIAFDIHPSEKLRKEGVEFVPFDTLLETSDIISLHCPLNTHTHHIINKSGFSKMKKGVMLINTSRGALIDTKAAINSLKNEKLGYLGIDVYEQEEALFFRDLSESIIQDDQIARLLAFPNVLLTSHQGFFTHEALEEITTTTLANITAIESGVECGNEVIFQA